MPGVTVVGGGSSFPATAFQAAALNFSTYIYPEDKFSYTTPASDVGEPFALGGGLAVAFNLPGLTELLLSRKVLPRIFDGTIHSWDDPGLVVDNPTLAQVHQPIMVIKRYDMSGSTILFKKALSLMDRSTGFAMSPYESDTFKIAENNSVMVDTSQQSGVIVGNYPYTITYLSPIDALAQNADMASIQHINGDFIPCTTETLSNSINSIDFESANSLNPYTDFAVAIDVPIKEAYPLTIVVNYLINPSNISADYTTAVHTLKFLWWFLINPTYATETLFIPLFNTALGNKTLSFLSNVQFQDKGRLFGRSICDPTLSEAWTFKNPCVHGQCAHSLPFQEASVTCICDFGYENYLFSDCREPTALFRRDWPSIVEYSLFGIGGLVCLTIAANRGQDSIKNIAPNCCLFITFGCFAGNLSILFQAASATKYSCALITVVPAFAFGAIFGLYIVFRYKKMARSGYLKDSLLFVVASILAVFNAFLAGCIVAGLKIAPVPARFSDYNVSTYYCGITDVGGFGIVLAATFLALNMAILISCLVISYLCRNTAKRFNESRVIAAVVYLSSLFLFLFAAVAFGISADTLNSQIMHRLAIDLTIWLICTGTPLILFIGPLQKVFEGLPRTISEAGGIRPRFMSQATTTRSRVNSSEGWDDSAVIGAQPQTKVTTHIFQVGFKRKRISLWASATLMVIDDLGSMFILTESYHLYLKIRNIKLKPVTSAQGSTTDDGSSASHAGNLLEITSGNENFVLEFRSRTILENFTTLYSMALVDAALDKRDEDDGFKMGGL